MPTTKDFKLEELSKYFHLPEKAVAKELGICLTSLKKICRSYGESRKVNQKHSMPPRTLLPTLFSVAHGGCERVPSESNVFEALVARGARKQRYKLVARVKPAERCVLSISKTRGEY